MAAPIEHLEAPTRARLRSTQILTSLPQVISELVQNSLDAGARQVDVSVDCEEWTCCVRDDGCGMSKEDLSMLGRYGTSKAYEPGSLDALSTFGFRGEALASAADLSILEISSRTARSRQTWSTIVKSGKSLYDGPAIRWRRESQGTTVSIRDAFCNLPVRRLSHPTPARSLDLVRREIEVYALVFPHVAFSVENTHVSDRPRKESILLKIPKTASTLAAFRHIYGRALTEHVEHVNTTSGDMKLDGFISLDGAHTKTHQLLYINRHPLAACDLHRAIDSRFSCSSFAKHALDESGETSIPRSTTRRSPRKSEKNAVYVLNLTIPPRYVDNCLEPQKAAVQLQNNNRVIAFLSETVQSFLTQHGFLTPDNSRRLDRDNPLGTKRRKVSREADNGDVAEDDELPDFSTPTPSAAKNSNTSHPQTPVCIPQLADSDHMIGDLSWTDPATRETFVIDQRTGNSYPKLNPPAHVLQTVSGPSMMSLQRRTLPVPKRVQQLTGVVEKYKVMPQWIQKALDTNDVYRISQPNIPAISLPSSSTKVTQPHTGEHGCQDGNVAQRSGPCRTSTMSHYFRAGRASNAELDNPYRRLDKRHLRSAKVINQVDRKFIACLIRDDDDDTSNPVNSQGDGDDSISASRALVLIDQHGADERVRVERFLKELCLGFLRHGREPFNGVKTRSLCPPIPLLLTQREASSFRSSADIQKAFEAWGFRFVRFVDLSRKDEDQDGVAYEGIDGALDHGYTQLFCVSIPEVVAEKLLMDDELRELVKGYLARLETDSYTFALSRPVLRDQPTENDEDFPWLKALRWCPRELLDLINSKACRGAIMFNDHLTITQCERLVNQLSRTAFPFQCAHGRPSIVPLTNLGQPRDGVIRRHGRMTPDWTKLEE